MKRGRPPRASDALPNVAVPVRTQEFIDGFNHGIDEAARHLTARLPYYQTDWHNAIMEFVKAIRGMKDKP
jgi:hypothetical protein